MRKARQTGAGRQPAPAAATEKPTWITERPGRRTLPWKRFSPQSRAPVNAHTSPRLPAAGAGNAWGERPGGRIGSQDARTVRAQSLLESAARSRKPLRVQNWSRGAQLWGPRSPQTPKPLPPQGANQVRTAAEVSGGEMRRPGSGTSCVNVPGQVSKCSLSPPPQ